MANSTDKLSQARFGQYDTHREQRVKQHIVYDNNDRPLFVFTASRDARDGDPCTVTEYVYAGPNTTRVMSRQEDVYLWKAIWDTNFTFDSSTDYDSDGDGVL